MFADFGQSLLFGRGGEEGGEVVAENTLGVLLVGLRVGEEGHGKAYGEDHDYGDWEEDPVAVVVSGDRLWKTGKRTKERDPGGSVAPRDRPC